METQKLVWNGCDSFVKVDQIINDSDYEYSPDKEELYHKAQTYKAFDVIKVEEKMLEKFAEDDIIVVVSGKGYEYYIDKGI